MKTYFNFHFQMVISYYLKKRDFVVIYSQFKENLIQALFFMIYFFVFFHFL